METLDAEEWTYWIAEYNLEPWGEWRADLRTAKAAAATANVWLAKGNRYTLSDLILDFPLGSPKPQTMAEAIRAGQLHVAASGGTINGIQCGK